MEKDWLSIWKKSQLEKVLKTNEMTEKYGLSLREEDAKLLLEERSFSLKEQKRVEFLGGITEKLIYEFCDCPYLDQSSYVETMIRLQEIFYLYKNETEEELTDDELLHLMREQFEKLCYGDLDYLESTCLAQFAQAIRRGYRGHRGTDGYGEYARFDEVQRWDEHLYFEVLKDQ